MAERLKNLDPEQLARLHPRVSEKMARASDGIRNRLEEARRMNMDELRELQRSVARRTFVRRQLLFSVLYSLT